MAKRIQAFFLEDWLLGTVALGAKKKDSEAASPSAQSIIKAWAGFRESLLHKTFNSDHLEALKTLASSRATLHVADPQARVLLAVLSSENLALPQESYPFFLRLLYVWVRKSRQTSQLVDSAVDVVSRILSLQFLSEKTSVLFSDGILLLGALSFQTSASDKSKSLCFDCLCKLLEEGRSFIFLSDELAINALAGIGYALSSSTGVYFRRILGLLLSVWSQGSSVYQGLLLLHLMEWVLSNSFSLHSTDNIDSVRELLETAGPSHSSIALVMLAAGVLRAANRSGTSGSLNLKKSGEDYLETVARGLLSRDSEYSRNDSESSILSRCFSLALSRSGSLSYRLPLLVAVTFSLLLEVFPLKRIYDKVLHFDFSAVQYEVKNHVNSAIFKEAGSLTGVLCNQYASAEEDNRNLVQKLIWGFCKNVYSWHRQAKITLRGSGNGLDSDIEKIVESAFLMVVVFASGVTKHGLDTEISVRILISFSCMEYFRRIRLSAYMDTIRAVILKVQENESACVAFVESMPLYSDLISYRGSSESTALDYMWSADDVQTARIVFCLRVIPTFVEKLPPPVFKKAVAPTMFLYLGHPNPKVSRYSHSLFASFISSAKDSPQEDRVALKEQLGFYYVKRSLENYPKITPFEGLASGVSAIVRHLPPGSPTIFYCIHTLVEKARSLCRTLGGDFRSEWDGEMDHSKKMLDLLLRLLPLTDVQVLPSLMKLLAETIAELALPYQKLLLNQLVQQIAESDDVIRKPSLVSWLQSLSYLCSYNSLTMNRLSSRL